MGEIWFVRHGQASYGSTNYDRLSPLGHQQAEWLGAHLSASGQAFDQVVCGSLRRHRETLDGIRKSLPTPGFTVDTRLNEMSYFALETAFLAETGDPHPTSPDEGARLFRKVIAAWVNGQVPAPPETFAAFRGRVLSALSEHARDGLRVLVVSSGGPKGILMQHVLNLGQNEMTETILSVYNASVSRFSVSGDRLSLLSFNDLAHLDRPDRRHAWTFI